MHVQGKPIYVALAQRKDVRRQHLEQQFSQGMGGGPMATSAPMAMPTAPYAVPPPPPVMYGMAPHNPVHSAYGPPGMYAQWAPMGGPHMQQPQQPGGGYNGFRGGRGGVQQGGRGGRGGGRGAGVQEYRGPPQHRAGAYWGGAAAQPQSAPVQQPAAVASATPIQSQKQQLGEQLYPLVKERQPVLAGKITGETHSC